MNTALFTLRCLQLGLRLEELDMLTAGMVEDMCIEQANDNEKYAYKSTQEDFDKF